MTNEDRNTIIELIEDLRAYARDWEWKYGEEWDAKILHVASILTALLAGEGLREAAERVVVRIRAEGGHGQRVHQLVEELASALAAPAPQEERKLDTQAVYGPAAERRYLNPAPPAREVCPACDGFLDGKNCTCPTPAMDELPNCHVCRADSGWTGPGCRQPRATPASAPEEFHPGNCIVCGRDLSETTWAELTPGQRRCRPACKSAPEGDKR